MISSPQNTDLRAAWFGQVSPDWKLGRAKNAFRVVSKKVGTRSSEYDLLSLTVKGIILRDVDSGKGKFPESFDAYQEVKKDDIVFCLFDIDETPRTVGLSDMDGMVTGAYTVVRCTELADPRFVTYFYLSIDERKGLRPFYTGLRKVVRPETFLNAAFPIPDLTTQRQIADFLDGETARIDLLIEKKQRLVNKVAPRFEALIHEARETGDWRRFGFCAKTTPRPIPQTSDSEYVPLGLFNRGRGFFRKPEAAYDDLGVSSFFFVEKGDLVFSGQFAWEGAVGLVSAKEHGCVVSHRYPVYSSIKTILNEYLFAYFRSHHGRFLMENCSRGAAGRNRPLNTRILEKEKIPVPNIELQTQVAKVINFERSLNDKIAPSIDRLKEYRSALITAAVTGQIDVATYAKSGTIDRQLDAIQEEMGA